MPEKQQLDCESQEYLWWSLGAAENHRLEYEGVGPAGREIMELIAELARLHRDYGRIDLLITALRIWHPWALRHKYRRRNYRPWPLPPSGQNG